MSTLLKSQCLPYNNLYYDNVTIGYWVRLYPLLGNLGYS